MRDLPRGERAVIFTYVCKTCGEEVPADDWELARHSLTHGQILTTEESHE